MLEQRKGGKPVPPAESAMVDKLFADESSLTLARSITRRSASAKDALSEGLEQAYLGKLFTNNFGWSGLGLLAVVVLDRADRR